MLFFGNNSYIYVILMISSDSVILLALSLKISVTLNEEMIAGFVFEGHRVHC